MDKGTLYLIPSTLGDSNPLHVLPIQVKHIIDRLDTFIVENSKSARKFIKSIAPEKQQSSLTLFELNKHTEPTDLPNFIQTCLKGQDLGLLSDAGCPGIADPGADIVSLAHKHNIQVVPLVGPSSILLAMMASGFNGQSFAFNGYLPIDKNERKTEIKRLERISFEQNQTQSFIETPYRNNKLLEDLCAVLGDHTEICVACDITLPKEFIKTKTVKDWKKNSVNLHKRPTLFIIHKS
ncbi:SAM-dependent methyltransferase [Olleya sp. YS]|uniref:SAM-dependent methyltransferase n=1 Tax=Olleya sp. YS TaxID=3028318 RepID=UPI00243429CC|nr:SAM-dependent methyltransferase [Olleya sp. YS]WGD34815.1 SAM-dependent methyltransferase [Olleya sp. YS]